jgi:hypothetical protein
MRPTFVFAFFVLVLHLSSSDAVPLMKVEADHPLVRAVSKPAAKPQPVKKQSKGSSKGHKAAIVAGSVAAVAGVAQLGYTERKVKKLRENGHLVIRKPLQPGTLYVHSISSLKSQLEHRNGLGDLSPEINEYLHRLNRKKHGAKHDSKLSKAVGGEERLPEMKQLSKFLFYDHWDFS